MQTEHPDVFRTQRRGIVDAQYLDRIRGHGLEVGAPGQSAAHMGQSVAERTRGGHGVERGRRLQRLAPVFERLLVRFGERTLTRPARERERLLAECHPGLERLAARRPRGALAPLPEACGEVGTGVAFALAALEQRARRVRLDDRGFQIGVNARAQEPLGSAAAEVGAHHERAGLGRPQPMTEAQPGERRAQHGHVMQSRRALERIRPGCAQPVERCRGREVAERAFQHVAVGAWIGEREDDGGRRIGSATGRGPGHGRGALGAGMGMHRAPGLRARRRLERGECETGSLELGEQAAGGGRQPGGVGHEQGAPLRRQRGLARAREPGRAIDRAELAAAGDEAARPLGERLELRARRVRDEAGDIEVVGERGGARLHGETGEPFTLQGRDDAFVDRPHPQEPFLFSAQQETGLRGAPRERECLVQAAQPGFPGQDIRRGPHRRAGRGHGAGVARAQSECGTTRGHDHGHAGLERRAEIGIAPHVRALSRLIDS
ncbi:MAG: hypothetical protein HY749_13510 [Gammaproteobacteria bacterium]|nr:hypothetical protein [Gammaproteobacteria bacterium]